jgi:hypothetical protein
VKGAKKNAEAATQAANEMAQHRDYLAEFLKSNKDAKPKDVKTKFFEKFPGTEKSFNNRWNEARKAVASPSTGSGLGLHAMIREIAKQALQEAFKREQAIIAELCLLMNSRYRGDY